MRSSYRPEEDIYRDHRCTCGHLDSQHDDGCPWCGCERFTPRDQDGSRVTYEEAVAAGEDMDARDYEAAP